VALDGRDHRQVAVDVDVPPAQCHAGDGGLEALACHRLVLASPVLVVFDHFGGAQARLGTDQPGFPTQLYQF
jgi:hypothetical protein